MKSRSTRRIRPELDPLDRRDVPGGAHVLGGTGSASVQVANSATTTTYTGPFVSDEGTVPN